MHPLTRRVARSRSDLRRMRTRAKASRSCAVSGRSLPRCDSFGLSRSTAPAARMSWAFSLTGDQTERRRTPVHMGRPFLRPPSPTRVRFRLRQCNAAPLRPARERQVVGGVHEAPTCDRFHPARPCDVGPHTQLRRLSRGGLVRHKESHHRRGLRGSRAKVHPPRRSVVPKFDTATPSAPTW